MEREVFQMELTDEVEGVFAISLVPNPAIQSDFIYLSEERVTLAVSDEDKRVVTGAVLIPDIQILRYDADDKPYFITWDKPTIEASAFKFMNEYKQKSVTLDHVVKVPDVTVYESWIKDSEHDKSVGLGIDVPVGTWMTSMKINDDILWDLVKKGIVKGFSIEGKFKPTPKETNSNLNEVTMSENEKKSANPIALLKEILGMPTAVEAAEEPAAPEAPSTPELPAPGTGWVFRQEMYDELLGAIAEIKAALMAAGLMDESGKPVEAPAEEAPAEAPTEMATVEDEAPAEEVVTEELAAEPEVEEEVEMLSYTDNVVSKPKKVKFDGRMSTEERIKARFGLN